MSRTARVALAVVVGFTAAVAAIVAAATVGRDDDAPEVLGGVDVFDYCQANYGAESQALLVGTHAFAWRCTDESNGFFQLAEIDWRGLCVTTYGGDAEPRTENPEEPYSWECVR